MTELKLKPCPFCSGKAHYYYQKGNESIVCEECGAKLTYLDFGDAEDKLIRQWNTRPIEDELDKKNGYLIGTCHDLHDIVEEFRAECGQKDLEIKRLREALEEIKKTVEDAQDTVYPFHLALDSKDGIYILEVIKEAFKG